jgi:hypothetical protein
LGVPPAPDLVFPGLHLGVEVTEYLEPTPGGSALRRLEVQRAAIMAGAKAKFERSCDHQLFVTAWWNPGPIERLTHVASYLSDAIAAIVTTLVRNNGRNWRRDWRRREDMALGRYLFAVDVKPARCRVQWESAGSATIPDPIDKLQNILDGKAAKLAGYRKSCRSVWLLIVADPSLSTYFSPDEEFEAAVYRTAFDKVCVFDRWKGEVLSLQLLNDRG